jgi:hypothetical protein
MLKSFLRARCARPETTLRELDERGDIIKRIHRGLTERGIERATASYVLAGDAPRIGRMNDLMQGIARQASLDPDDDLGL